MGVNNNCPNCRHAWKQENAKESDKLVVQDCEASVQIVCFLQFCIFFVGTTRINAKFYFNTDMQI